jgi:phage-related minor tail protein
MAVSAEALDIILRLQGVPTYTAGMKEASAANKEYEASVVSVKKANDEAAASQEKQVAASRLASKALKVTAIGLAAAAFESVKASLKWNDMGKEVSQQTGLVGKNLDNMMETIQHAADRSPYAIGEISDAAILLKTKFGESDQQIEHTAGLMTAFSQRAGGSSKEVTTSLLSIMQAYRTPMSQVLTLTDELTAVSQATQKPMGDLLSVVEKFAPKLQAMGFGLQSTIQLLGVFQASGISTSMMGRGLATALTKAEKEHKETNVPIPTIIGKHMGEITHAKSQQEAYNIAMEFFGKQVGPSFARALYNNAEAFKIVDKAMEQSGGTQKLLTAEQREAAGRWAEMKNQLFGFEHEAGDQLVPVLLKVMKGLMGIIKGLMGVTEHGKLLTPVIIGLIGMWTFYKLAMLVARGATVAWAITTTIATAVAGGAETAIWAMVYAFDGLDVAMAANPIGLIVLAIVALIAIVGLATYYIATHFTQTLSFLKKWGFIVAAVILGPFVGLTVFVATHWSLTKSVLSSAIHWIEGAWPKVEKVLTWPFEEMWKVAQKVFKEIESLWKKIPGHSLVEKAVGIAGSAAKLAGFAEGGVMPYSGFATINENSPGETVWLPGGSSVQPSPASSLQNARAHTPNPAPTEEEGRPIYIEAYLELPHSGSRQLFKLITREAAVTKARK